MTANARIDLGKDDSTFFERSRTGRSKSDNDA